MSKSTDNMQNGPAATATSPAPPDQHVPIAGFNAQAVEGILKQGYDTKASFYKPDAKHTTTTTPQSPWGIKRVYTPFIQTWTTANVD
jgi:hypothetical protein